MLRYWEFWNTNVLYLPILPYLLFLFIRVRNCFFFNAANPGIEYGGFLMESKWKIHSDAPQGFFPETIFVDINNSFEHVMGKVKPGFDFPLIAKPDIGSKGRGVMLISNMEELKLYHASCPVNYIIQQKISYPLEAGIFYVRYPDEAHGKITGIVEKQFVKVTGDGLSTIRQLLLQTKRSVIQMEALEKIVTPEEMDTVLPIGKAHVILEIGNHARGSLFLDATHRVTQELTMMIDAVCKQFDGFYFGRLDIRFESWEELQNGINYSIIELNGAGSEPTHIYDPSHSILFAWKEICRHWKHMHTISGQNHKRGIAYLNIMEAWQMFKNNAETNRLLASFEPARVYGR